jgi:hypothetical protein
MEVFFSAVFSSFDNCIHSREWEGGREEGGREGVRGREREEGREARWSCGWGQDEGRMRGREWEGEMLREHVPSQSSHIPS